MREMDICGWCFVIVCRGDGVDAVGCGERASIVISSCRKLPRGFLPMEIYAWSASVKGNEESFNNCISTPRTHRYSKWRKEITPAAMPLSKFVRTEKPAEERGTNIGVGQGEAAGSADGEHRSSKRYGHGGTEVVGVG